MEDAPDRGRGEEPWTVGEVAVGIGKAVHVPRPETVLIGRVNVRIPVGLIRAGMKLKALIPPQVADDVNKAMREKGIGFDIRNLKDEYVDELVNALRETEINVDSEEAEVHVYAE